MTDIKNNLNLGMVGNCAYSALIDALKGQNLVI